MFRKTISACRTQVRRTVISDVDISSCHRLRQCALGLNIGKKYVNFASWCTQESKVPVLTDRTPWRPMWALPMLHLFDSDS